MQSLRIGGSHTFGKCVIQELGCFVAAFHTTESNVVELPGACPLLDGGPHPFRF